MSTFNSFKNQDRTSTATNESTPSSTRGASLSIDGSDICKMSRSFVEKQSVYVVVSVSFNQKHFPFRTYHNLKGFFHGRSLRKLVANRKHRLFASLFGLGLDALGFNDAVRETRVVEPRALNILVVADRTDTGGHHCIRNAVCVFRLWVACFDGFCKHLVKFRFIDGHEPESGELVHNGLTCRLNISNASNAANINRRGSQTTLSSLPRKAVKVTICCRVIGLTRVSNNAG